MVNKRTRSQRANLKFSVAKARNRFRWKGDISSLSAVTLAAFQEWLTETLLQQAAVETRDLKAIIQPSDVQAASRHLNSVRRLAPRGMVGGVYNRK
jgi:hypothetical protein